MTAAPVVASAVTRNPSPVTCHPPPAAPPLQSPLRPHSGGPFRQGVSMKRIVLGIVFLVLAALCNPGTASAQGTGNPDCAISARSPTRSMLLRERH